MLRWRGTTHSQVDLTGYQSVVSRDLGFRDVHLGQKCMCREKSDWYLVSQLREPILESRQQCFRKWKQCLTIAVG